MADLGLILLDVFCINSCLPLEDKKKFVPLHPLSGVSRKNVAGLRLYPNI